VTRVDLRFASMGGRARVTLESDSHAQADLERHAASIRELFGDGVDVYVDGGRIEGAVSTVVDMTGAELVVVREGALTIDEITHALKGSI
jgi:tRNA A37 threonylcarbamoyladenosine synthetase subunit TsaC/SUA5/YrdC